MRTIRISLSLLPLVAIMIAAHLLGLHVAEAATTVVEAGQLAPGDLIDETFRGITTGDWFLAAGAALSLTVMGARWGLARWWPSVTGDLWGVAITAGLAGFGALGHAWIADADPVGAETLLGAVKVWASAVFLYVTGKKLVQARPRSAAKAASVALLIALAGCPGTGPGPGPVVADVVIDCLGETRSQIDALIVELSPLVFMASPDWEAVYQRAKQAGKAIGGCALAELVNRYLAPAPGRMAPATDQTWAAHDALERFRAEVAGGATFKTASGNL